MKSVQLLHHPSTHAEDLLESCNIFSSNIFFLLLDNHYSGADLVLLIADHYRGK